MATRGMAKQADRLEREWYDGTVERLVQSDDDRLRADLVLLVELVRECLER